MNSLLIKNARILTMSTDKKTKKYYPRGKILVEGNEIVKVDDDSEIKGHADLELDASGKVVLPGLINGHNHHEQSYMRPITQVNPGSTYQWLHGIKMPITKEMRKEDYYLSNLLTCVELIKGGVTCSLNSFCTQDPAKLETYAVEESIKATRDTGMRSLVPVGVADKFEFEEFLVTPQRGKNIMEGAIKKWNHAFGDRVRIWPGPAGVFSASEELWAIAKDLAAKYNTGIHTHIASAARGEVDEAQRYGLLSERLVGGHCVWLDDRDVKIMADSGMKVVHNPWYKLGYSVDGQVEKFGDGIAPITDMVRQGMTVGLGTDGCMGATQDMFREARVLAYTQHYRYRDKALFPPTKLLEMITLDCAKTMLWNDQLGSIEPGKKADLVLVDLAKIKFVPMQNIPANLVYQASAEDVETVIIDGTIVMKDRNLETVNEKEVIEKAQKSAEELFKRAGLADAALNGFEPWAAGYKLPAP